MINLAGIIRLFERIPHDLIALVARIAIGTTFWRSAMTKIDGFSLKSSTFYLFENDYRLPLIPPELAAYMATATELTMPLLIWSGLLTRFAAAVLLVMTLVIEIFVYPFAFDTHGLWAVSLIYLMKFGAGTYALDHILSTESRITGRVPAVRRNVLPAGASAKE
jgi:putative oxidoreductase